MNVVIIRFIDEIDGIQRVIDYVIRIFDLKFADATNCNVPHLPVHLFTNNAQRLRIISYRLRYIFI